MCPERLCKDCGYVFYPQYRGQFMTCFCSEPISVDWTPEYTRIIGNKPEKIIETWEKFPCCMSINLVDWQQDLRQTMLLQDVPDAPGMKDYSLYYKSNVEWKQ